MIIAHRGGQPENTLEAFQFCVLNSVDGIEFDVWRLADGEFIVTHDSEINGHFLEQLTLDKLKMIDSSIPTLKETLDTIKNTAKKHFKKIPKINIEIKPFNANLGKWLKGYLNESEYSISDFIVTSFLHTEIDIFHQEFPEMEVGWILACSPMELEELLNKYPYVSTIVLGQNVYSNIRLKSKNIWIYGEDKIRQTKEVVQLFESGIQAFITDYPIQCQKILNIK